MNISVAKIIDKMIAELQQAKVEGNYLKVKEHFMAVRTLCDLVLDENHSEYTENRQTPTVSPMQLTSVPSIPQVAPISNLPNSTKLVEDDANGDSLFDF
ncbi:YwdI family protein [Fredinandcohnia quinoae]|uniref:YwdI family protein n=1 Tax=Fredinandcohnia quinoae TaxID=2918902 RepID=A0AAW5DZS6_9BACI|nr:YwdI family protein [Fredinandcohnia sp. SECRCQ15]MCH1626161.1 YwdI family protein [Fredinandcohnia sp. SECRCQ15]